MSVIVTMVFIGIVGSLQGCHLLNARSRSKGPTVPQANLPKLRPGPYVILFALDGAGYDQFMNAIGSDGAVHVRALLGKTTAANLYEHAYSVPHVFTIMPSCSTAAWSSIVTGRPPAETGVAGDEFFVREENRLYAPIPISSRDPDDFVATINDDLIGRILGVPTVYQRISEPSSVMLLYVYHGATNYSTLGGSALLQVAGGIVEGTLSGATLRQSIAGPIDRGSADRALEVVRQHGIPRLLVVYFPGIDLYAHGAPNPLPMQTQYLIDNIDPDIGEVLAAYSQHGVLNDTYVIFTSDHGHTPVLNDQVHDLAFGDRGKLYELLERTGLRVRQPGVRLPPDQGDYQVVIADEGFAAYLYLANRSTCARAQEPCDWRRLPRFREDVLPVLRVLYNANRRGERVREFKGALDLIFSRDYAAATKQHPPAFEIFNGKRLVPIPGYLARHPRPDLVQVVRRMRWLGEGPYGDRAGDIVLIGRSSASLPIQDRYYFSRSSYFAWHGSLTVQDSHIPLVIAKTDTAGDQLKAIVEPALHTYPSALDVTPLIERLLTH